MEPVELRDRFRQFNTQKKLGNAIIGKDSNGQVSSLIVFYAGAKLLLYSSLESGTIKQLRKAFEKEARGQKINKQLVRGILEQGVKNAAAEMLKDDTLPLDFFFYICSTMLKLNLFHPTRFLFKRLNLFARDAVDQGREHDFIHFLDGCDLQMRRKIFVTLHPMTVRQLWYYCREHQLPNELEYRDLVLKAWITVVIDESRFSTKGLKEATLFFEELADDPLFKKRQQQGFISMAIRASNRLHGITISYPPA